VLERAPRTVSRESARNTTRGHPYRALRRRSRWTPEPVSRGDPANSWIPGCGSMCGHIWPRVALPSRLPDVSNACILTACRNTSQPGPSMWACMCCHAEPCTADCWRHCARHTRYATLGQGGPIDRGRFSTGHPWPNVPPPVGHTPDTQPSH
jgi:hypothetical protein